MKNLIITVAIVLFFGAACGMQHELGRTVIAGVRLEGAAEEAACAAAISLEDAEAPGEDRMAAAEAAARRAAEKNLAGEKFMVEVEKKNEGSRSFVRVVLRSGRIRRAVHVPVLPQETEEPEEQEAETP